MNNLLMIPVLALLGFSSCKKETASITSNTITEKEKSDLIFLREEEKLAHDVYVYSFKKYNQTIFSNISSSEQNHMTSVLNLLNTYGINDPVQNLAEGVFQNTVLQQLYTQLTLKSDSSLLKALEVGATIEDLDIYDIKRFYGNTSNSSILGVYDRLTCGSRNHLRSFVSQLNASQINYIPKYISQTEFNNIVNSANEQCGKNSSNKRKP